MAIVNAAKAAPVGSLFHWMSRLLISTPIRLPVIAPSKEVPPQPLIFSPLVVLLAAFAEKIAMDSAEHCRMQSEECRRLLALAQNEAEASALKYLSHTWLMIAGQIDRYREIMKEAAQKK
jgi:hypothetical protein